MTIFFMQTQPVVANDGYTYGTAMPNSDGLRQRNTTSTIQHPNSSK